MKKNNSTKNIHFKNGEYKSDRNKFHKEIIRMIIDEKGKSQESIGLEALLIGGGSGSGKSSIVRDIIDPKGYVLVDADAIKEYIPEYIDAKSTMDPKAADIVHEESSDIAMLLLDIAMEEKEPIIYDGTMKNIYKYERLIKELKDSGYMVQLIVIDADVEIALERAKLRFVKDGRFVSEETIRLSNRLIATSFKALKNLADSFIVFENSINGQIPREIAFKDPGKKEEILDPIAYKKFLNKDKI